MNIERALEGIENEDVLARLQRRIDDISDEDDEADFWKFRTKQLAKFNIRDPLASPLQPSVSKLPFPLAMVVSDYINEKNDYIKLHRLCDVSEMFTRFSVVVSLVHLHQSNSGFSDAIKNVLKDSIKRPSFGAWLGILRQALSDSDKLRKKESKDSDKNPLMTEIREYFSHHLEPALQGHKPKEATVEQAILPMRNHLAHAGRLPDGEAKSLLTAHQERFENEVVLAASFWEKYSLVIGGSKEALLAQGLANERGEFAAFENSAISVEQDHAVLVFDGKPLLDLYPMHAFLEVVQAKDEEDAKLGVLAPQLYCRMSDEPVVEFTVLHDQHSFSQQREHILEAWEEMFPVDMWQGSSEARKGKKLWQQRFKNLQENLSDVFVGRKDEMGTLKSLVKAQEHSVLWVTGKAGVGKSAVVARMIAIANNWDDYVTIPYYFRTGHSYCSTHDFLRASLDYLGEILGKRIATPDSTEVQRIFLESLREVAEESTDKSKRVVFMLDGLDEIERVKPGEILSILDKAKNINGVTWLCAGRPEENIVQAMEKLNAHFVFGEEGLAPLKPDAIRAILDYDLGSKKYDFYQQDKLKEGAYKNEWLDTIVERSEGLPIYVRLLTKDIARGNRELKDVDSLPAGLAAYYEDTLARLKVSSVGAALTTIFCLLAQAREPLDEALLYQFLAGFNADLREGSEDEWKAGIQRALSHGSMMMTHESTPEGKPGWQLYHESFNDLLLTSDSVKEHRKNAQFCIPKHCAKWAISEVVHAYAMRHYPYHLALVDKSEELFSLMRDAEFIQQQKRMDANLPGEALLQVLKYAGKQKDKDAVAEFAIRRGKLLDDLRQESPFDALRGGDLQRALDLSDLHDAEGRSERLLLCAWQLVRSNKVEQAEKVLKHLFESGAYTLRVKCLPVGIIVSDFLTHFDAEQLHIDQCEDEVAVYVVKTLLSNKQFEQAITVACGIEFSYDCSRELSSIASALCISDPERAGEVFGHALVVASKIEGASARSKALSAIENELPISDPERAREVVKQALSTSDPKRAGEVFKQALSTSTPEPVREVFNHALMVEAEQVSILECEKEIIAASEREYLIIRSGVLSSIVSILCTSNPVQAITVACWIENELYRSEALSSIGNALSTTAPDYAAESFEQAITVAFGIDGYNCRSKAMSSIVNGLESLSSSDPERALTVALRIKGTCYHSEALSSIASALCTSDPERAAELLEQAITVAFGIDGYNRRSEALSSVVNGLKLLSSGDPKRALRAASGIKDPFYCSYAFSSIAEVLFVSDPEQAGEVCKRALTVASGVKEPSDYVSVLCSLAKAVSTSGTEHTIEVTMQINVAACGIEDSRYRSKALSAVTYALTLNDIDRAEMAFEQQVLTASGIEEAFNPAAALSSIASELCTSNPEHALTVASGIKDSRYHSEALSSIASELCTSNPERALTVVSGIKDSRYHSEALSSIAKTLCASDPERALTVTYGIKDSRCRSEALSTLIKNLPASNIDADRLLVNGALEIYSERLQDAVLLAAMAMASSEKCVDMLTELEIL